MNLIINGRNVEVTDRIREYAEKRINRIERQLPDIQEVRAELTKTSTRSAADRYTYQITLLADKTILRAEESSSDVFASIDAVSDKLARQVEKVEGRRKKKKRASLAAQSEVVLAAIAEESTAEDEQYADFQFGELLRRKQFKIEPMSEEAALEQLELLDHDFFMFFNANTNDMNVIYRRKDGNYGLIEPEVG